MDEGTPRVDRWLDERLDAAARTALRAPRRRLMLPSPGERTSPSMPWVRRHRTVLALVALNGLVAAAAFAAGVGLSSGGAPGTTTPAATPSPSLRVGATVPVAVTPDADPTEDLGALAAGDGSVWVAASGEGNVVRIDQRTDALLATIHVGTGSSPAPADPWRKFPSAVAVASDGAVWVTGNAEHAVVRIDPATNRVAESIPVGVEPTSLAADGTTLWVAAQEAGVVLAVDTVQRRVVHRVSIVRPSSIAVSGSAVWVVDKLDGTILRLDAARAVVTATISSVTASYDYTWVGVAAAPGGVWAIDEANGLLVSIETSTARTGNPIEVGVGAHSLAVAAGVAWVATGGRVVRVDLGTNQVSSLVVPRTAGVAAGGAGAWVLAAGPSRVVHVVSGPWSSGH